LDLVGGSHGGTAGWAVCNGESKSPSANSVPSYGEFWAPAHFGSGGGLGINKLNGNNEKTGPWGKSNPTPRGGDGGGILSVTVNNSCEVNGAIRADGMAGYTVFGTHLGGKSNCLGMYFVSTLTLNVCRW
jgi:hypothetical protein